MSGKILENSSFGILRTNPKITGNVKVVVDSSNNTFIESISANQELAKSKYKAIKTSASSGYQFDVARVFSNTPSDIFYDVKQSSSDYSVLDNYGSQYELDYCYGSYSINSKAYSEEFGIFAPVWLEDNIPDYFVIFKLEGPATVNNKNAASENATKGIVENPDNFKDLFLSKAKIIKTFDLTNNTNIGKYIRNYKSAQNFPVSAINFTTRSDQGTYWNGVGVDKPGGFTSGSENVYKTLFVTDRTILENDFFITSGFERNRLTVANIINLEFLFDDPGADKFSINRYFGLYVNAVNEGTFRLDGNKFYVRSRKDYQTIPSTAELYKPSNENSHIITNKNGVKLYVDDLFTTTTYDIPLLSNLTANDFIPSFSDVSQLTSIFYVKDKNGNFHNLNYKNGWLPDEIRLQETSIDVKDFTGYEETILTAHSLVQDKPSKASTFITVNSNPLQGDRYVIALPKKQTYLITVDIASPGDVISIQDSLGTGVEYVTLSSAGLLTTLNDIKHALKASALPLFQRYDYSIKNNTLIMTENSYSCVDDNFSIINQTVGGASDILIIKQVSSDLALNTIVADSTFTTTPGTAYQLTFNPGGTTSEVATAMAAAINNIKDSLFESTSIGNKVIVIAKVAGPRFNDLIIGNDIFMSGGQSTLITTSPAFSHPEFYLYKFQGGTNNPNSKAIIDINLFSTFNVPNRYVRTTNEKRSSETLSIVKSVFYYVDEEIRDVNGRLIGFNNFDKYCTVAIDDRYNIFRDSLGSVYLYELYDIPFGRFSIFPIKTMDFNYLSTEYGDEKELNTEKEYYISSFSLSNSVAIYTGTITTGVLNVTSLTSGIITPGQLISGTGIPNGVYIQSYVTGIGGIGTYTLTSNINLSTVTTITSYAYSSHEDIEEFYSNIGGFTSLLGVLDSEVKFFLKNNLEKMQSPNIESEYDRLKENTLVNTAVQSRTVPYISKWVYRNGKDCREKDYRLNVSEAFGLTNFSPSSDEKTRNSNYFTHEWYYLQQLPSYYSLYPSEILDKTYSYFPEKIDVTSTGLLNVNLDYFTEYFTVDYLNLPTLYSGSTPAQVFTLNVDTIGNPTYTKAIKKQFRYSLFEGASSQNFATTLFRGVKVIVKERVENASVINYDVTSIKTKFDTRYNGYKFSCVLIPHSGTYGGIKRKTIEYEFVENRKYNNITFLIYLKIDDILTQTSYTDTVNSFLNTIEGDFIDRTILYALKSKLNVISNIVLPSIANNYSDIKISGAINPTNITVGTGTPSNPKLLASFIHAGTGSSYLRGVVDTTGQSTLFTEEILINKQGSYNSIATLPVSNATKIYKISGVTDNNILNILDTPAALPSPPAYLALTPNAIKNGVYTYQNGGYNFWTGRLNKVSFGYIQNLVDQGDPSIKYTTVMEDGSIQNNLFIIELQTASHVMKSNYLRPYKVENKSSVSTDLSTLVGTVLNFSEDDDAKVSPIFRHNGYYQPKFNNVINFVDPYTTSLNLSSISKEYLIKQKMRDMNTQIMLTSDFGIIPNFYLHKVNDVNPASIIKLSTNSSELPVYPLSGQIAIDYKDFYTFKSNWDANYFEKYFEKGTKEEKVGTRSVVEKRSFFGSKVMKIQDSISVETFNSIRANTEAELTTLGNEIIKPGNPYHIAYYEDSSKFILDVYLDKKLVEIIAGLGVYSVFNEYVNEKYGFGSEDTINDDVNSYIQTNILPRYELGNLELFVLKSGDITLNNSFPSINSTLTDSQKYTYGYKIDKNVQFLPLADINNFNLRLIYNKTSGYQYSISPSFRVNKK